jgi:hypothetical protein
MDGLSAGGITHPWPAPPEPGLATEVVDGILWMRLPLPMLPDHVNVYALGHIPINGIPNWSAL